MLPSYFILLNTEYFKTSGDLPRDTGVNLSPYVTRIRTLPGPVPMVVGWFGCQTGAPRSIPPPPLAGHSRARSQPADPGRVGAAGASDGDSEAGPGDRAGPPIHTAPETTTAGRHRHQQRLRSSSSSSGGSGAGGPFLCRPLCRSRGPAGTCAAVPESAGRTVPVDWHRPSAVERSLTQQKLPSRAACQGDKRVERT